MSAADRAQSTHRPIIRLPDNQRPESKLSLKLIGPIGLYGSVISLIFYAGISYQQVKDVAKQGTDNSADIKQMLIAMEKTNETVASLATSVSDLKDNQARHR